MEIEETIKHKLEIQDRCDIAYIHPVISNEEIAKYISAFANQNGGIILFGVKDDGLNLSIKKSAFKINQKENDIRLMITQYVPLQFGDFYTDSYEKLEYISVGKSETPVYFNDKMYIVSSESNRPIVYNPKTLFLSYCQNDTCIADIIEKKLNEHLGGKVIISRYTRDVKYKDSFKGFMDTIPNHDFVLTIVSDSYLKSKACMYEVGELIRDHQYANRLLFVVISNKEIPYYELGTKDIEAKIYSELGRITYVQYWESKYAELKDAITKINSNNAKISPLTEMGQIQKIIDYDIQQFMDYLADTNGEKFSTLYENDFKELISIICAN